MKKRLDQLLKSRFAKGVLSISSGSLLAQAATVLLSPIITRLYSPADFGVLNVFTSIMYITSIGTFEYEYAIPISKSEREARRIMKMTFRVLFLYVLIIFLLLWLLGDRILEWFNLQDIGAYLLLIPLANLIVGADSIFRQWNFRYNNYQQLSLATIMQGVGNNGFKIIFGLMNLGASGLVGSRITSLSAGLIPLYQGYRQTAFKEKVSLGQGGMAYYLRRYRNFPKFRTPSLLIQRLSSQLPSVLLTYLFSVEVSGWFGLANSILMLPMTILGNSIGDVFYGEISNQGDIQPGRIRYLSRKLSRQIALIAVIPMIIFALIAPELFQWIFGEAWLETGRYVQLLSLSMFSRLVLTPTSRIYEVLEEQRYLMYVNLTQLIFVLIAFMGAYYLDASTYATIFSYSVALSLGYLLEFILAQKLLTHHIQKAG